MNRSTTLASLSLAAAAQQADARPRDLLSLLEQCPLPLAVIDLETREVAVSSPRFAEAIGLDDPSATTRLGALVPPEDRVAALCDLVLDGAIDTFEGQRTLQRLDGKHLPAASWVSVIDLSDRRWALWVLALEGAYLEEVARLPTAAEWPRSVGGVVIGRLDATLQIEEISRGLERGFGYQPEEVVGHPAVQFVHPDDIHLFLSAIAAALGDRGAEGTELRVRDRDDRWRRMHMMVVPLEGEELRIGYTLIPASPTHTAPMDRVHQLEQRLRRIAGELQSADLPMGPVSGTVRRDLPGLADLSPRQWEILDRLARGERVPGIAERLFLSQSTVRNHLTAIYRRLGVNS